MTFWKEQNSGGAGEGGRWRERKLASSFKVNGEGDSMREAAVTFQA